MPLYDYQCDHCGHRFEVRQGIKEDPLTVCPQCEGTIRRVIHPVGIVFKGSGFYITDNRRQSSTSNAGAGGDKKEKKESPTAASAPSSNSPGDTPRSPD
ncbi:MAG TPA: FmdB family zinc ribbon protein [Chloroflexota bacterium]|nr:FmdB family zinc ribbon protein [Chloroflexota bacterium]